MHTFEKSPISEKNEYLDKKWYDRFEFVGGFQPYTYFDDISQDRENQKKLFINGEIEYPQLDYPRINHNELDYREQELVKLKKDILTEESDSTVRQMYRWKINEKIAEVRMMRATLDGNDKNFDRYSSFVYGTPEKNIHNYTMWKIAQKMHDIISSSEDSATQQVAAAQRIIYLTKNAPPSTIVPHKKTDPIHFISSQEQYTSDDIKKAFENALYSKKIEGWDVLLDPHVKAISTSQDDKKIKIPTDQTISGLKIQSLIEHEIFTHAQRRSAGDRTKIHLLGLGLDRYAKGEEGLATYREGQIMGESDYAGFGGHFTTSLAKGLDGIKRDFIGVFDIIKDYHIAIGKDVDKASSLAWNLCMRTFRGTTGHTPGACFTKDIAYREGNIGIHTLINNNDSEQARFLIGKYDPTNPRHIWILDQLNITENDLEKLAQ